MKQRNIFLQFWENIVSKVEIASYKCFLLFPNCLQSFKPFATQSRLLTTLEKNPLENIVGIGENAGNQHFPFFPQCFFTIPKRICF